WACAKGSHVNCSHGGFAVFICFLSTKSAKEGNLTLPDMSLIYMALSVVLAHKRCHPSTFNASLTYALKSSQTLLCCDCATQGDIYTMTSGVRKVDEFIAGQTLGEGQFWRTRLGIDTLKSNRRVALKFLKSHLSGDTTQEDVSQIESELTIGKTL